LANRARYLDRLSEIYRIGDIEANGRLTKDERREIKVLWEQGKYADLLKMLINLERFPYDEPYIGFLRADASAFAKNPKTVKRIQQRLERMGPRKIISGANRAKSESRRLGQSFRKWVRAQQRYRVFTDSDAFLKAKGIVFLDGGDKKLKDFARKHFGYRRKKGLDFVARAYGQAIIGEAKLITTPGGTQDKSFREGVAFLKRTSGGAYCIAILDGVVWVAGGKPATGKKKKGGLYTTVSELKEHQIALSALLLYKFLGSFKK